MCPTYLELLEQRRAHTTKHLCLRICEDKRSRLTGDTKLALIVPEEMAEVNIYAARHVNTR